MSRKWLIRAALAALALFVVAWAASPVFAVKGLIHAARDGDARALEKRVDFPAVRADLKLQLRDRLVTALRDDPEMRDSPWAGLGLALAPTIVDGAVDVFVTPQAISAMARDARAPKPTLPGEPLPDDAPAPEQTDRDAKVRYSYRDLNTFGARVTDPDRPDQSVDFLMQRRGLFDWKLTRIVLPETLG